MVIMMMVDSNPLARHTTNLVDAPKDHLEEFHEAELCSGSSGVRDSGQTCDKSLGVSGSAGRVGLRKGEGEGVIRTSAEPCNRTLSSLYRLYRGRRLSFSTWVGIRPNCFSNFLSAP